MYSIIVYTNQISNVIIPQHHLKHPSAILHHHCLNLNGISSKKDYPDRNDIGSNKQFGTKEDAAEESTGPLKVHFLISITNAMNQDTPCQRSTDLNVNQHFSNHGQDVAEFMSMRNCTATSYAFPLLNDAKTSFRFNGIVDSQFITIRLCDEEGCLAVTTVRLGSLFENDDTLWRGNEADDLTKLEKPFDVFLNCEEDSTVVCRMRGQLHILVSPLLRRFSPSDSIFESAIPYIWIVHTLLLLVLGRLFYESALCGKRDRMTLSFLPQNINGLPDLTEVASASVSVSAIVGPLQLRRGMSMLQGDVLAGCVGFHSSLCLPTLLTLDDSGSLLLFSWRDYNDASQRFVLRWNSSDYVGGALPYRHVPKPPAQPLVSTPVAVSHPKAKNLGDWFKILLHGRRQTTDEPPPPPQEETKPDPLAYHAVAAGSSDIEIYRRKELVRRLHIPETDLRDFVRTY